MIRIVVDSSADYTLAQIAEKGLELVPMNITFGEDVYVEGKDLSREQFYELLEKSPVFPKTSQPTPQTFLSVFGDAKQHGDEVICILLASSLSGTYQSATLAKEMVDYEKIYIIDSCTAAPCIQVLADYALTLRKENKPAIDIVNAVEAVKTRVKVVAMIDTLEYLYRGGRLSKATATIGEIAKVKPVITLAKDGTIEIMGKCLGRIKAMNYILKHLEKQTLDPAFPMISVYSYGLKNCEKFEEKLHEKQMNFAYRAQLGPTIGTHVGGEVFGLVYVVKE